MRGIRDDPEQPPSFLEIAADQEAEAVAEFGDAYQRAVIGGVLVAGGAALGRDGETLARSGKSAPLKAVLDGFAAMAFASSFGIGVLLSAVSVAVVQGLLTLLGVILGSFLPDAHIAALTATGGLMLVGISLRLMKIREIPVGDLLPALIVAPVLTQLVVLWR